MTYDAEFVKFLSRRATVEKSVRICRDEKGPQVYIPNSIGS
jgi:hypothetical protein